MRLSRPKLSLKNIGDLRSSILCFYSQWDAVQENCLVIGIFDPFD